MNTYYIGKPNKEICSVCNHKNTCSGKRERQLGIGKKNYADKRGHIILCGHQPYEHKSISISTLVKLTARIMDESDREIAKVFIKRMLNKRDKKLDR